MTNTKADQASRYRSMQVLLFVFSLIFFAIIAYGYFNLFAGSGYFLAFVGSTIVAVFAWYLARVVGTSPGGLRKNWVLFVPLAIVSAAGVYNSLMLYIEGNRIVADAVADSQSKFGRLETLAETAFAESGAKTRANRINTLAEALYSEIRNPLNCGQGPEARRLIASLQRELPGFTPLSNPAQACDRNEELISDYRERIGALVGRADWNNPELHKVIGQSRQSQTSLEELRSAVVSNFVPTMLRRTLSVLEGQDSIYRDLLHRLSRHANVRDLDPGLHLTEVQSLGNAFKLPALFLERLDQPATYVYLMIALGFDLLMVHLFQLAAVNRIRQPVAGHALGGAW